MRHSPGDATFPALVMPPCRRVPAAGMLRGNQAEIRHQLPWVGEASDIAEFGHQRRCRDQSHTAQRL